MKILVTIYLVMCGVCFRGVLFIPSGGWLLLFVEFFIFYWVGLVLSGLPLWGLWSANTVYQEYSS